MPVSLSLGRDLREYHRLSLRGMDRLQDMSLHFEIRPFRVPNLLYQASPELQLQWRIRLTKLI